ncbi:MAG TPA: DnaJ domain-containing protein [Tepidisphaeraceae bacterium]|jgi:DnaJ-class molecular chaperone|nr:DnaJ domain-containing protein [Tepidisphaeraceae bacterium]
MVVDHYQFLELSHHANLSQIGRAFRTLARPLPVDRDPAAHERVARLREAHDTLAHPASRADYDRELARRPKRAAPARLFAEPLSLMDSFQTHRPSAQALEDRIARNFTGRLPKSRGVQPVNVEIMLTREQAASGGMIPFDFPVARVCPRCAGTGTTGFFECDACSGHGMDWELRRLDVLLPRNVADGASVNVSLGHLGIGNVYLTVHVRVAAKPAAFE